MELLDGNHVEINRHTYHVSRGLLHTGVWLCQEGLEYTPRKFE